MKRIIFKIAVIAGLMFSMSACGGGNRGDVDLDTVITDELTDSMSRALGAFMGVNLQDEIGYSDNVDDYIEGYQLVAAHSYSREKLMGIRAGMYAAEQFMNMKAQGVDVNRDLFMREFRKYIQKKDLSQEEYRAMYEDFQRIMSEIENVLVKRDSMRAGTPVPQPAPEVETDYSVIEEVVSDVQETGAEISEDVINAQEMSQDVL